MIQIVNTGMWVGGGLIALFAILLSMPQSQMRSFLLPILGWCFALFCGAYILSPFDVAPEAMLGPFGLIDDAGALVAGIYAARSAIKAAKENRQLP
jgi:uncharacterized membrane protein YkvA (DUF1232 family)